MHNPTNAAILSALSKSVAEAHVGNSILNFEQNGWRHDVREVLDLFVLKDLRGEAIAPCFPAATKFGNGGAMRTWATFFTEALNELPKEGRYIARQRKGDNAARVFVRCIRADLVSQFREIVSRKLGLTS